MIRIRNTFDKQQEIRLSYPASIFPEYRYLILKVCSLVAFSSKVCPRHGHLLGHVEEADEVRLREANVRPLAPREIHPLLDMEKYHWRRAASLLDNTVY